MKTKNKIIVGFLVIILSTTGWVSITMNNVRIIVRKDETTFKVPREDITWFWMVSGRELYPKLFDGTSQMNRNRSGIKVETFTNGMEVTIIRTTPYIRGPVIIDTYKFRGDVKDVELFPMSHTVEIFNAKGKFYRYEVRDLIYDGDTYKLNGETELTFGRNMKVTLHPNYRWAWIYKTKLIKAQYNINSNYEKYNLRLFDPASNVVSVDENVLISPSGV